jgi:hypothetical protein
MNVLTDNLLLLFGIQQTLRSWALFVIQGAFQPGILVAPSNFPGRLCGWTLAAATSENALASMELAQSRLLNTTQRLDAAIQDSIELVTAMLFQLHTETPVGPHATLAVKSLIFQAVKKLD